MNKLYTNAFKKILARLSVEEITTTNVNQTLEHNKIKPIGSILFHMMARQQMDTFLKIPCPVQNTSSDLNKATINSAKTLRASFSINERKVCSKCPHRETCPFFAREGQENNVNALPDLLLYMQAINNKAETLQPSNIRFFESGYKICNETPSLIEDLKQDTPEILSYQKARAQYDNYQKKQGSPAPFQKSVQSIQQNESLQPKAEAKRKPKVKQSRQINSQKDQKRRQFVNQKVIRKDEVYENRRKREYESSRPNPKREKLREYSEMPRRFSLDDSYVDPRQRQETSPKILRYAESPSKYDRSENKRYPSDRNPSEPARNKYKNQERREKKDKGYEEKIKTRSQTLYNERKNHEKSLEKVKQSQLNFDEKFEKAGKMLRDTKILEAWDSEVEDDRFGNKNSPRERREKKTNPPEAAAPQRMKTQVQSETINVQSEPRRGRRVKK